jgi:hypothetical protein
MQESIEKYLKKLEYYGYTEDQREAVRQFRENAEHMPFEQYQFLVDQKLIFRTRKLKKKRNIYFFEDKLWILNHYYKSYEFIGWLHSEEFLAERNKKETEERELIEQRKAEKKRAKQALKEVPVKQKRKRITR